MRRTSAPLLVSLLAALVLGVLFASAHAGAQRRPQTARPCPHVIPDGQVCTAWGRGRACHYGSMAICVCQKRSARERVLHWYCGELGH